MPFNWYLFFWCSLFVFLFNLEFVILNSLIPDLLGISKTIKFHQIVEINILLFSFSFALLKPTFIVSSIIKWRKR
jgi:hypothetical protein